jgi:hypothetical protein
MNKRVNTSLRVDVSVDTPAGSQQRKDTLRAIWLALTRARFSIKSPLRDVNEKRKAYELGLSLDVIHYGLHRLEGTGRTLEDLPLGELLREAGYEPHGDVLPYRGSVLG